MKERKKNQSYYTCVIIVERSALGDFTWRGALEFYALILAMAFFMRHEFNFFPQQFFLFQSWSFVWLVPKYIEGLVHVYTWPVRLPPAPTFDNSCTCPIWTYWFKNISWTTVWFQTGSRYQKQILRTFCFISLSRINIALLECSKSSLWLFS